MHTLVLVVILFVCGVIGGLAVGIMPRGFYTVFKFFVGLGIVSGIAHLFLKDYFHPMIVAYLCGAAVATFQLFVKSLFKKPPQS